MHDHAAAVADQHTFAGAIKNYSGLTQALLILTLTLQSRTRAQKTEQTATGEKNYYGAEKGKYIAIYTLPMR
jgi:hypothetical protein